MMRSGLVVFLVACSGVSSNPDNGVDAAPDGPPTTMHVEMEPNDERQDQIWLAGERPHTGTHVITGSCKDDSDLDYMMAELRTGEIRARLEWDGAAHLMFDPEINVTGGQVRGASPIEYVGFVEMDGEALWAVDCSVSTSPASPIGVQYTLRITFP